MFELTEFYVAFLVISAIIGNFMFKSTAYFLIWTNEYEELKTEDIAVPAFSPHEVAQFEAARVWQLLTRIKTNKFLAISHQN